MVRLHRESDEVGIAGLELDVGGLSLGGDGRPDREPGRGGERETAVIAGDDQPFAVADLDLGPGDREAVLGPDEAGDPRLRKEVDDGFADRLRTRQVAAALQDEGCRQRAALAANDVAEVLALEHRKGEVGERLVARRGHRHIGHRTHIRAASWPRDRVVRARTAHPFDPRQADRHVPIGFWLGGAWRLECRLHRCVRQYAPNPVDQDCLSHPQHRACSPSAPHCNLPSSTPVLSREVNCFASQTRA